MDITQELLTRLDKLTTVVGDTAPKVWEIYVRQVYAEAVGNLVVVIMLSVAVYYLVKYVKKEDKTDFKFGVGDPGPLVILSYMVLGLLLIFILSITCDIIKLFINPEYYAMKELLKQFF